MDWVHVKGETLEATHGETCGGSRKQIREDCERPSVLSRLCVPRTLVNE